MTIQRFFPFPSFINEWDVADFFVGSFNHDAYHTGLTVTGALCIIGAKGNGKTHLSRALAAQNKALVIAVDGINALMDEGVSGPIIVDDCDHITPGQQQSLLHLINWQKQQQKPLIVMACHAPSRWGVTLPDLASRLQTFDIRRLFEPDDQSLRMILVKLFHDQQLDVEPGLIEYLAPRIERSFATARDFVESINRYSLEHKEKITIKLAQKLLTP